LIKMNSSLTVRANATYSKAGSIVTTAVASIRTILSLNAVPPIISLYQEATTEAYHGAVDQVWLVGLANGVQWGSFLLSYVVVTLFGSWILYDQVRDEGCDPSGTIHDACDPAGVDVFGALMAITFAAAVLPQVSVSMEAMIGARAACYHAIQVIQRTTTRNEEEKEKDGAVEGSNNDTSTSSSLPAYVIDSSSTEGMKLEKVVGSLAFEEVSFAYPARPQIQVLRDFSLEIRPGTTVALVGPSGQGKSTVMQLLERFYDPTEGSVTLDGTNLRALNVKWLRQQIGLVSQEPKLFAKSIRENIALGLTDAVATQEQIEKAARMANAHDFIMSFPKQYDTQVGDSGTQLSGGQKQVRTGKSVW
jgi:ATP-binding cassette subfamily B (MDR/TAP) protein 1